MRCIKRAVMLALLLVATAGTLNVQAAYNRCLTEKNKSQTIKIDLNKDGKKEIVKSVFHYYSREWDSGYYDICINGKPVFKKCDNWTVRMMDINTSDKYIEFIQWDIFDLKVYRYNGKKWYYMYQQNGMGTLLRIQ